MKTRRIDAATKTATKAASKAAGGYAWIRDICLAIEEQVGECTVEEIHGALLRLQDAGSVVLYPCDDPTRPGLERQGSFAIVHPVERDAPRVLVGWRG